MTDTEKFRLRHFVEKLVQQGECVVHDDPIDLIDVAAVLDCNPHAVWFRAVGPEKTELVGNVMGTRRRLAAALDTDEPGFPAALRERLQHPVAPIEVPSAQAPVQEVVLTGDDADLTTLPVHLQHGLDGAPYISASIDYARDAKSGFTNIGCRRLMLRGPRAAGIDLNAPAICARSIRPRLPGASACRSPLRSAAILPIFSPRSPRRRRWTSSKWSAPCAAHRCRS